MFNPKSVSVHLESLIEKLMRETKTKKKSTLEQGYRGFTIG